MSAPTCCYCGADESQGPLDPRRCDVEGAVRCVLSGECDLRAELRDVTAERDALRASARDTALDRARAAADLVTPLLLSHYEHALDEADATQRHTRPVPSAQRATALQRARALRDVLTALGAESAGKAMRDERLARIEAGSEPP